jgi:hypothetical protein
MSLIETRRQKSMQMELLPDGRGETSNEGRSGEASTATNGNGRSGTDHLMEEVVERDLNLPNRRMRTRTSGGVGGAQRGEPAAPYPDRVITGRPERAREAPVVNHSIILCAALSPRAPPESRIVPPNPAVRVLGIAAREHGRILAVAHNGANACDFVATVREFSAREGC